MLLNEFLKEYAKVQKLEAVLDTINARLSEQATEIRQMAAQIQLGKVVPTMVTRTP